MGIVCICPLQAMGKLHQLKVLGSRPLVVEYADPKHKEVMQEGQVRSKLLFFNMAYQYHITGTLPMLGKFTCMYK